MQAIKSSETTDSVVNIYNISRNSFELVSETTNKYKTLLLLSINLVNTAATCCVSFNFPSKTNGILLKATTAQKVFNLMFDEAVPQNDVYVYELDTSFTDIKVFSMYLTENN